MRTLRELKKIFIGEFIAVMMLLPFSAVANGDIGISFVDFIKDYVIYNNNWFVAVQFGVFTVLGTYIVYTLYRAIERDVMEVKAYFDRKKKTTD